MNIKVVELFAGVGGFRCGLEAASPNFEVVWMNQWEPGRKTQHAFDCYEAHFGKSLAHSNEDIGIAKKNCPEHDLLVGGFPCQDYSVARTQAKGMEGKKGVLWWDIKDIIQQKQPKYILLENVDRLLKSPASQRGRDFGIILKCFDDLGYIVEWRVINAAEYGYAQRRRRTFIFACKKSEEFYKKQQPYDVLFKDGFFASEFEVEEQNDNSDKSEFNLRYHDAGEYNDLADFSDKFKMGFKNSGFMTDGMVYTATTTPIECRPKTLTEVIETGEVDEKYFLNGSLEKWQYLKGSKKVPRTRPNGERYFYSEGGMNFPDDLSLPSRTMLTSESSVNRSTHVIEDYLTKKLRLLTPVECERLNGFPDNWSNTGMPEKFRYFVMGNALVVPLVTRMGQSLLRMIDKGSK